MDDERYALLQSKYVAEREKVEKLEGWLIYLFRACSMPVNNLTLEMSDYIKAMEEK